MARLLLCLAALGIFAPAATAQPTEPLRLQGVLPGGTRGTATESFSTYQFTVANTGDTPRDARVVIYYPEQEDVHYARDVWVPAHASLTTWLPVGPAPKQAAEVGREVRMLLYDRTGGANRLVLPTESERVRSRVVLYRKREPTCGLIRDPDPDDKYDQSSAESTQFALVVRSAIELSERVSFITDTSLAPAAEAFDGLDVLILAGSGLDGDPAGRAAVRRWVQHGGTLWVMLDQMKFESVAAVLGDDFNIGVVDRVGLTTVHLKNASGEQGWAARDEEQPVDLVRVVPGATDKVSHTVNGWPAAFHRRFGRGKVVFTALGPRGWYRERTARDRVRESAIRKVPVENPLCIDFAGIVYPNPETDTLQPELLRPLIADEIGYNVVSRRTVALVLGGFVAALLVVGIAIRRSRQPEALGWAVPAVVVVATGVLVLAGERSRNAVPPTIAAASFVTPVAATGEVASTGLYAVYNPASGPVTVGSDAGSMLDLDAEGLDGQLRRRVQLDTDVWRWDGLSLPAGVRTGAFRSTARAGKVLATGQFGPDGLRGKLETGGFGRPADAIALTVKREPIAANLSADGSFSITPADALPPGQFLAGSVLTDLQQRRQTVHQQLLAGKLPRHLEERDVLLAWADAADVPFAKPDGARVVGTSLLAVPIEYERTPPNTRVTIPSAFLPPRKVLDRADLAVTRAGTFATNMRVRFQLPPSVVPLRAERVVFTARVSTPQRKFTVSVPDGKKGTPVFEAVGPSDPIRVELTGASVPQADERGGVSLQVDIGGVAAGQSDAAWKIEAIGLEVVGTTGGKP